MDQHMESLLQVPIQRARCSLEGLSVGDAFGETFFINPDVVSGLGDRDTTCAIVGGIVASHTGLQVIPSEWLESREHLPEWPFKEV